MTKPVHYATALSNRALKHRLSVRLWLYCVCFMVLALVVIGGATRLTDSGLSITEWKPVLGIIPPLNDWDWLEAFDKYQQIPEFRAINHDMDLGEFKFIYWWEWAHRFVGRLVGLVVLVPLVIFWWSGRLEQKLKPRLVLLFALGGLQGFIGWWMVKSGLSERVDVSQYRLAVHLTLAAVIFAWCLWLARGLVPRIRNEHSSGPNWLAPVVAMAILLQIFLGALVAGLDAGLAFNDWPLMDGMLVPQGMDILEPVWLNFFENPKTVQFVHRMAGYAVFLLIITQMILTIYSNAGKPEKRRTILLFWLGVLQVALGVATLVLGVPLGWAIAHQAGAFIVFATAIIHWRALHGSYPPETAIVLR